MGDAHGDAVGTVWSAFAAEKIALIQRAPKLYCNEFRCIVTNIDTCVANRERRCEAVWRPYVLNTYSTYSK
eukprot:2591272-Prymnesium_polylepis.1